MTYCLCCLALGNLLHAALALAQPAIRLENYRAGTTIRYPVPLLRGTVGEAGGSSLVVVNESSDRPTRELKGLVHKGRFKALTELVPGPNRLVLRSGKQELRLTLTYRPQTNAYIVRVIYMTDNTGATAYQTPLAKDPQDYAAKLDTALKLMQTFTAERMNDLGHGRRTFNLELDDHGKVKVHTLKGDHPAAYYYALADQDWWRQVYAWSDKRLPMARGKNLVIPAYTRFDPAVRKAQGHTALGGGGLALFGSGALFSWPGSLADVFPAFGDATSIDGKRVHDDSAGRGTRWALASTTLGAALHEVGHTFGLPHSRDPMDIMTRGFDHFHRAFTFIDPPSRVNPRPVEFKDREVAYFAPISAAALRGSRWFALDGRRWAEKDGPAVRRDENSGDVLITASHGLRYLGIDVRGDAVSYRAFWDRPQGPREFRLPRIELGKGVKGGVKEPDVRLRLVDDGGLQASAALPVWERGQGFVRTWHFSKVTRPWAAKGAFVEVDAKQLREIEAAALTEAAVTSKSAFVDLLERFGQRSAFVAAYAARSLRTEQARKVKLRVGSDDALRVWVNGKLVIAAPVLRAAHPDEDSATVELQPGENRVLVEVSQAVGGWGFYFRVEDEKDGKLQVGADGRLTSLPAP